jgi:hypothetical protein
MLSFQSVQKFVFKYKLIILAVIISIAIAIYLKREVLESFFKNITEMFEETDKEVSKVTSCKVISDKKVQNWCYDGCTNSPEFKKANAECLQSKCKSITGYKKIQCMKSTDIVEGCVAEVASAFC